MLPFKDLSIKWKTTLIITLACAIVLVSSISAIMAYDLMSFRERMIDDLSSNAEIMGKSNIAALSFDDQRTAYENLSSLKFHEYILRAFILDKDKNVFASHFNDNIEIDFTFPSEPQDESVTFGKNKISLFKAITLDEETIGWVFLESDLSELYDRLQWYMKTLGFILIISISAALLLSLRLQRYISYPLSRLAGIARRVSIEKDYSIRAAGKSGDEIGLLVDSFNEMLEQIQQRDLQLEEHAKHLEDQVSRRTEELTITNAHLVKELVERYKIEEALKESEQRFRSISDSAFEGIVIHDNGLILDANDEMFSMFGYGSRSEIIGKNILDFTPPEFHELVTMESTTEDDLPYEIDGLKKDGSRFYLEIRGVSAPYEGRSVRIAAVRDITERKLAEKNLEEAKKRAEDATKLKDKFVSLVAHDLRSPISSISARLGMLIDNYDRGNNKDKNTEEFIKGIKGSCDVLMKMIEELLTLSKLQGGRIVLNRRFHSAYYIANYFMSSFLHTAANKGVTLVNDLPKDLRLYVDMDLYGRVIQNLISNAVKYSNRGDVVTIFASKGINPCVSVRDTGVGMSKDNMAKLFKDDVIHTTMGTADERGNGLGLLMCKEIVEGHGGTIKVESSPMEGSVFHVELPMTRPTALLLGCKLNEVEETGAYLKKNGVKVIEAENPGIAHNILVNELPHIVIIDITTRSTEKLEFLEKIKNSLATKSIPVIVIAPENEIKNQGKADSLGADHFMKIPVRELDLQKIIKQILG